MTNTNNPHHSELPHYTKLVNLADVRLGTKVLTVSDDFFAECPRMLQPTEPIFIEGKYDDNGKWMDGWESRRRRDGKEDYCILELGVTSNLLGFEVDTRHFTGNFTPGVSIFTLSQNGSGSNTVNDEQEITFDHPSWQEIVSVQPLRGDQRHFFDITDRDIASGRASHVTHLKIIMHPDGGIARFRAYGRVSFDEKLLTAERVNLSSIFSGARAILANNEHFGKLENILMEHHPINMSDGWETRRRREPGNDWGIIQLAQPAVIEEVKVDTSFFKGNFPDTFSLQAANLPPNQEATLVNQSMFWEVLLDQQKLAMDSQFTYKSELKHRSPVNYIKVNIFPDGGIARLKLYGKFI